MPRVPQSPGVGVLQEGRLGYLNAQPPEIDRSFVQQQDEAMRAVTRLSATMKKRVDEAIETRASDLANQYYRNIVQRLSADGGALTKQEADVVAGYNGKSFVEGYMSEFRGVGRDILSTVKDPRVVEAALKKMSNFDNHFTSVLANHEGKEARAHRTTVRKDTIGVAVEQIASGADPVANFGVILEQFKQDADDNGRDLSAPETKAWIRRSAQNDAGAAIEQSVASYVFQNDFTRAQDVIRRAGGAGIITPDKTTQLATKVTQAFELYRIDSVGNLVGQQADDRWRPSTMVASSVPKDSLRWAKTASGATTEHDAMEHYMSEYGTAEGAIAALSFSSPERLTEAEGKMLADGGVQSPARFVDYMTPSEKAAYTTALKKYRTSPEKIRPLNITDALAMVQKQFPEETFEVQYKMATKAVETAGMRELQRETVNASQLTQLFEDADSGVQIDAANYDLSGLYGPRRVMADRFIARVQLGETDVPDDKLYEELFSNPQRLAAMSETDFLLLRANLSDTQFAEISARRMELQGGIPKEVKPRMIDTALDYCRGQISGWEDAWKDPTKRSVLSSMLYEHISLLSAQVATKDNPLSQDIVNQEAYRFFDQVISVDPGFVSADRKVRRFDVLDAKSIPQAVKRFIEVCQSKREGELSDGAYVMWLNRYMTRPTFSLPEQAIPQVTRERLERNYREATGRTPSANTLKELFFADAFGNTDWLNALQGTVPTAAPGTASAMSVSNSFSNAYLVGDDF